MGTSVKNMLSADSMRLLYLVSCLSFPEIHYTNDDQSYDHAFSVTRCSARCGLGPVIRLVPLYLRRPQF